MPITLRLNPRRSDGGWVLKRCGALETFTNDQLSIIISLCWTVSYWVCCPAVLRQDQVSNAPPATVYQRTAWRDLMSRITTWTHHITGQMAGTFQQGGRDMNDLKRNYHRTRLLKHQPMGNNREGPAIKEGGSSRQDQQFSPRDVSSPCLNKGVGIWLLK